MKIKIKVPVKNKKWKVTFIKDGKYSADSRTTASLLYSFIEGKLIHFYKAKPSMKTQVVVDYGVIHPSEPSDWKNEGTYESLASVLYTLACFLEDYLTENYRKEKFKQYGI